jgi:hypothetical protein
MQQSKSVAIGQKVLQAVVQETTIGVAIVTPGVARDLLPHTQRVAIGSPTTTMGVAIDLIAMHPQHCNRCTLYCHTNQVEPSVATINIWLLQMAFLLPHHLCGCYWWNTLLPRQRFGCYK